MAGSEAQHQSPPSANLAAAYAAYTRQLNQQQDDPQSISLIGFEYQAKARGRQLETLLHLSHFSDYLVLVSGAAGAGKSTFIEQFLRVQPADACIVHLALTESVSAPWVVRQLAAQLPVQLPNHASLEASILAVQELAQELTRQEQVLLLVVDDAQWLDEDALELLANILPRSAKVDSRPHVILCADQSVVERIEAPQFAELRQERFYHLVLAPFSQEESADYLRQRLQRIGIAQGQGLAPIQLLQLHHLAKGQPGHLNMLANKALAKGGFVQQAGLPLLHIAGTIFVVLVLAGIWLFNYASAMPVGDPESIQPVVIEQAQTAAVVDFEKPIAQALPALEPIELSKASENVTLQPVIEPAVVTEPATEEAPVSPMLEQPDKPVAAEPNWPTTTGKTEQTYSYSEVLALPPQNYSLQILGARLEPTLEAFLANHKLKQPYYILQLERNGSPWHLLLVGKYSSASDARAAVKSLPVALRNQQPWPRAMLKIQQQIRNKFNTSGE